MDNYQKNVIDHFSKRKDNYESYSEWTKDEEIIEKGLAPLRGLSRHAVCLDLGAGTGFASKTHSKYYKNPWILFDINGEMINKCRESHVLKVIGDANALPFVDESIGFIFCRQVFHYLDPLVALGEINRVLASRGVVTILQKTNPYETSSLWHEKLLELRQPLRKKSWKTKELVETIECQGFDVISCENVERVRVKGIKEWLSRGGILSQDSQDKQMELLKNIPDDYNNLRNYRISDGDISYKINWSIITLKRRALSPKYPYPVVSMIVERFHGDNAFILLQKRMKKDDKKYYGVYELPQGKLEDSESIYTSAKRELFAETSLKVLSYNNNAIDTKKVNNTFLDHIDPFIVVREHGEHEFLAVCFIVNADGEAKPRDIDRHHKWMEIAELEEKLRDGHIYPLNIPMIEKYIRTRRKTKGQHDGNPYRA